MGRQDSGQTTAMRLLNRAVIHLGRTPIYLKCIFLLFLNPFSASANPRNIILVADQCRGVRHIVIYGNSKFRILDFI